MKQQKTRQKSMDTVQMGGNHGSKADEIEEGVNGRYLVMEALLKLGRRGEAIHHP
jgi:hypothetical protein